jgi:hypothetical protein
MSKSIESKNGTPSLVGTAKALGTVGAIAGGGFEALNSGRELLWQASGHLSTTSEDLGLAGHVPAAAQWLIEQALLSPHGPVEAGVKLVAGVGLAFYGVVRAVDWMNRPA